MYIYRLYTCRYTIWVNFITTSLRPHWKHGLYKGNHPKLAARFRSVNYCILIFPDTIYRTIMRIKRNIRDPNSYEQRVWHGFVDKDAGMLHGRISRMRIQSTNLVGSKPLLADD